MTQLGALFPQVEIGTDPIAVRDFAQAAEDLGYSHVLAYDHVLGANVDRPDRRGGRWPYTHRDTFYEPLALFAFLAGVTRRIGLVTGIVILPQRQTVLVAKQAATVDVLSGGRLRLGVGLGWNAVEYEALGENFKNRGQRIEEQIAVLRALWTRELVDFEGRWHRIPDAGINPLPVQRPIPIWMGGWAEPVLRRVAAIADGWIVSGRPTAEIVESVHRLRGYVRENNRDPAAVGLQGGVTMRGTTPDERQRDFATWQALDATYVTVNTVGAGLATVADHIAALRDMKALLA
ncbi:MAG TPA: LLM class F420-dependent oxidoreductase [Chloroflexota bacterium]|nr:LLM class F420-dependent oxidoreductase [Chloroflexota bacterium]